MAWSPSQPPKDRPFMAQTEETLVVPALFHPDLQTFTVFNTTIPVTPKFWQDFPKPLQPRDRHGAKIWNRI